MGQNFQYISIDELVKRVLAYGLMTMSGLALRDVLKKLGKRLSR